MFTRVRLGVAVLAVCASLLAIGASPAIAGWVADFFVKDASGNATYEAMVIHPSAIYDESVNKTYVTYQGYLLDPYIIAYDHAKNSWSDPVKVGTNPLLWDPHGGPALAIDRDGYISIFFGAHGGSIRPGRPGSRILRARSLMPHDISAWSEGEILVGEDQKVLEGTYPQIVTSEEGTMTLFFRMGGGSETTSTKEDWGYSVYRGEDEGWSEVTTVFKGVPLKQGYYVNFSAGENGRIHAVATIRHWAVSATDYAERRGIYYLAMDADGVWRSASGETVVETYLPDPVELSQDESGTVEYPTRPRPWTRADLLERCAVPGTGLNRTNQMVVRDDGKGDPVLLYLEQNPESEWSAVWTSAQLLEGEWATSAITVTNDYFDAGDIEVLADGTVETYLTVDSEPRRTTGFTSAYRGGDIERWRYVPSSGSWEFVETVIEAAGPQRRFNNPQVVRGGNRFARVIFSEWNLDAVNFIHKVYLFGDELNGSRFRQHTFTPEVTRLSGANRRQTAVEVSKQGFPKGSAMAVVAVDKDFPDVLCGVPLAHSLGAPILLTAGDVLSPETAAEIERLQARNVIVLGGNAAIRDSVVTEIRELRVGGDPDARKVGVRRLAGADRYQTSVRIARELAARELTPTAVYLASGTSFADALAVSPLAANSKAPVLLSRPSALPLATGEFIEAAGASVTMLGGEAALGSQVESVVASVAVSVSRVGGRDRWETASLVGELGLKRGLGVERFVVASGANFPDAVTGAVLASRVGGVIVLTPPSPGRTFELNTHRFLTHNARQVLDVYIVGGENAISPDVATAIAVSVEGVSR